MNVLIFSSSKNKSSILSFTMITCGHCYENETGDSICKVLHATQGGEEIINIPCKGGHQWKPIKDFYL